MDEFERWEVLIGIIASVILPLSLWYLTQVFLPWYRAAALKLRFENREPFCQKSGVSFGDGDDYQLGNWIRLEVQNAGRQTARNIAGFITEVRLSDYGLRQQTKRLKLSWSANEPVPYLRPGEKAFLDVAAITSEPKDEMRLRSADPAPREEERLARGTYFLKIEVVADDTKPAKADYQIRWDEPGIDNCRMRRVSRLEQVGLGLLARLRKRS